MFERTDAKRAIKITIFFWAVTMIMLVIYKVGGLI